MSRISDALAMRGLAAIAAGLILNPPAMAAMPTAQQNALVQKYCAVCHTDAARNGGLSLEHFDAAHTAPSLAAMMLSKLTSGTLLETVKAASSDPAARAVVAGKMKSGAMGAAGIPIPDKATIDALIDALASEAKGAGEWHVDRNQDAAAKASTVTASILREVSSSKDARDARQYRLVLTCNNATREGEMQLAWAPLPKTGTLSAAVDGKTPVTYDVEGTEKMGNGTQVVSGPAAIALYQSGKDSPASLKPLPAKTLRIQDLFPNESVEFSFGDLPRNARASLTACFQENDVTGLLHE